jgi:hypothetical protein
MMYVAELCKNLLIVKNKKLKLALKDIILFLILSSAQ